MQLFAQAVSFDWERFLTTNGLAVSIVCVMIWLVVRYSPRLVEGHLKFLTSTEVTQQITAEAQKETAAATGKLTELQDKQAHAIGLVSVNLDGGLTKQRAMMEATRSHAEALMALAEVMGPEQAKAVKPHVEDIRRILKA